MNKITNWEELCEYIAHTAQDSNITLIGYKVTKTQKLSDETVVPDISELYFERVSLMDKTPYDKLQTILVEKFNNEDD